MSNVVYKQEGQVPWQRIYRHSITAQRPRRPAGRGWQARARARALEPLPSGGSLPRKGLPLLPSQQPSPWPRPAPAGPRQRETGPLLELPAPGPNEELYTTEHETTAGRHRGPVWGGAGAPQAGAATPCLLSERKHTTRGGAGRGRGGSIPSLHNIVNIQGLCYMCLSGLCAGPSVRLPRHTRARGGTEVAGGGRGLGGSTPSTLAPESRVHACVHACLSLWAVGERGWGAGSRLVLESGFTSRCAAGPRGL